MATYNILKQLYDKKVYVGSVVVYKHFTEIINLNSINTIYIRDISYDYNGQRVSFTFEFANLYTLDNKGEKDYLQLEQPNIGDFNKYVKIINKSYCSTTDITGINLKASDFVKMA